MEDFSLDAYLRRNIMNLRRTIYMALEKNLLAAPRSLVNESCFRRLIKQNFFIERCYT
jgi:hypothetical protein